MASRRRFTVTVWMTIDEQTDEHLQTVRGIEEEIRSWLTDLRAEVERVRVVQDAEEATR